MAEKRVATTFPPSLEDLFRRRQLGAKFSLDEIRRLCARLGDPQNDLKFIHIAGTNGKGSVAAMCAAILQEAGFRTGLYTSPHLVRYHERFRMNGRDISDADLVRLLKPVLRAAGKATFFEITTALALCWFRERKAEWVVWETGLGGRLDATNIVTPRASVITHIGMDHMEFLGDTLEQIASEKAGILKPNIPAITPVQHATVMRVLKTRAKKMKSPLKIIRNSDLDEFIPPLIGEHQRWNTALAVEACRQVIPLLQTSRIREGLKNTRWPGRCQMVKRRGDLPVVMLDGAHNPAGAQALAGEIKKRWGNHSVTLIFGALADKDVPGMLRILKQAAAEIFLVKVDSERAAKTGDIRSHIPRAQMFTSLPDALKVADSKKRPVVIAGSLFLAGEALGLLGCAGRKRHPNERLVAKRP